MNNIVLFFLLWGALQESALARLVTRFGPWADWKIHKEVQITEEWCQCKALSEQPGSPWEATDFRKLKMPCSSPLFVLAQNGKRWKSVSGVSLCDGWCDGFCSSNLGLPQCAVEGACHEGCLSVEWQSRRRAARPVRRRWASLRCRVWDRGGCSVVMLAYGWCVCVSERERVKESERDSEREFDAECSAVSKPSLVYTNTVNLKPLLNWAAFLLQIGCGLLCQPSDSSIAYSLESNSIAWTHVCFSFFYIHFIFSFIYKTHVNKIRQDKKK